MLINRDLHAMIQTWSQSAHGHLETLNTRDLGTPSSAPWAVTSLGCARGREVFSETSHATRMGLIEFHSWP